MSTAGASPSRSTSRCSSRSIERIATDEERHELFFTNLVRWCLQFDEAETVAAVARRAAELQPVGSDIDAYQDKVSNVSQAGIFGH